MVLLVFSFFYLAKASYPCTQQSVHKSSPSNLYQCEGPIVLAVYDQVEVKSAKITV